MPDRDLISRGLGATYAELGITPALPEYRVYLRDSTYAVVGELQDWVKLSFIPRVNDVGTWALEVRLDNPSIVQGLLLKTSGIVIKRDGTTIFSGPVFTQYTRTATVLKVAGVCDNILMAARQVLPNYNAAPSLYTSEYEVITGVASTVIQTLVSRNLGPLARTSPYSRRVTALTIPTDPLLGGTVTARGRFGTNVLALIAALAVSETAGGLRVWIAQSDATPATLVLNIAEARDQTDAARFGVEQQTAIDVEDVFRAPGANYFFAGSGDALGADRTIYEDFNGVNIVETGLLLETFVDVRQSSDPTEMAQKLAELVAGAVSSRRLTVTPIEGGSTAYGTAWDIGDLVTAVVDGVSITKVIREIQVDLTPGRGAVVTPMLGDAGTSNDSDTAEGRMAAYINAVEVRLGKIEGHFNIPDDSITTAMIAAGAIGATELATNAVTQVKVADAAIGTAELVDLNVTTGKLADLAVTTGKLADLAVTTGKLNDLAVTAGKLAADAVTTAKILDLNVTTGKLADLAVTAAKLAADAVTTAKILDANVTSAKLASSISIGTLGVTGAATFDSAVTLGNASGDAITVTGTATFGQTPLFQAQVDVQGGTAGSVRAGAIIVNAASLDGSEELLVNGQSKLKGAVTVTTGGITVDSGNLTLSSGALSASGYSVFSAGLSVAGGDLDLLATVIDFDLGGTSGFTRSSWDGYVTIKHDGTTKYLPYTSSAPS